MTFIPDSAEHKGEVVAQKLSEKQMNELVAYIQTQTFQMFPVVDKMEKTVSGIALLNHCALLFLGGNTPSYVKVFNVTGYIIQRFLAARNHIAKEAVEMSKSGTISSDEKVTMLQEQFKTYESRQIQAEPVNNLRALSTNYLVECPRHIAIVPVMKPPTPPDESASSENSNGDSKKEAMSD